MRETETMRGEYNREMPERPEELEILDDVKANGTRRPWRVKKVRSNKIANSLRRLRQVKKSNRVRHCGDDLEFARDSEGRLRLHRANFCRDRMCPMCQWRRSLKVFTEVSTVMDVVQRRSPELVPIFLTLTQRNVEPEALLDEIGRILNAWYLFTNHYTIKNRIKGYFRALEITYNRRMRTYHPHIHAILMVDEQEYFHGGEYITKDDYIRLWRTCCKLDYDPSVDVRIIRQSEGEPMYKAISEVAKYTVKDAQIVVKDEDELDYIIAHLSSALRGRRLYAFGGVLKLIAKELFGKDKPDEGDLVHVEQEQIRTDVAQLLELYKWDFGLSNYFRVG